MSFYKGNIFVKFTFNECFHHEIMYGNLFILLLRFYYEQCLNLQNANDRAHV